MSRTLSPDPRLDRFLKPVRSVTGLARQIGRAEIVALPVVVSLILIAVVFEWANPNFLTPQNLTNLLVQISAIGTIAVGIVLVLLLGEIDLSAGAVSGLCAAITAVLSVKVGWPAPAAIAAGVIAGAAIGLAQGAWIANLNVPSLVVTLAGLLSWQGALLFVLGTTGTVNLTDPLITGIANTLLPLWLGWTLALGFITIQGVGLLAERHLRRRAGLPLQPTGLGLARLVLTTGVTLALVGMMSLNRNPRPGGDPIQGVPSAVVIFIGVIVLFDFLTHHTSWGRYLFAVGGNAEAARRAGLNVRQIRISVFAVGSTLAACGGILASSRLFAVNQSSGGGDVLFNAIAAAVIGGTSLFGGRGTVWSALLGSLVIGAIANGMDLVALPSSIKFMVTGAVLLLAVTLDAFARARREQAGR